MNRPRKRLKWLQLSQKNIFFSLLLNDKVRPVQSGSNNFKFKSRAFLSFGRGAAAAVSPPPSRDHPFDFLTAITLIKNYTIAKPTGERSFSRILKRVIMFYQPNNVLIREFLCHCQVGRGQGGMAVLQRFLRRRNW